MPRTPLNARLLDGLKPAPAGQRLELFDDDCPGLAIRITDQGVKSWSLFYRTHGRLRRLTLGRYPAITLKDARERARRAQNRASDGGDPAQDKRAERTADTFAGLAESYIEKHAKTKKRSWKEDDRILRKDLLPYWKHLPPKLVTRRMVRDRIDAVAKRAPVMANRTLAVVSKVFNFALQRDWVDANPAARIEDPSSETARDRVLSGDELRTLWLGLDRATARYAAQAGGKAANDTEDDASTIRPVLAAWLRLRLLTAQRGGELIGLRWCDVELDSQRILIPDFLTKNGVAHLVPLSRQALVILQRLRDEAASDACYVFQNEIGTGSLHHRAKKVRLSDYSNAPDTKGHDLRRTAATGMARIGVPRFHISLVLNHVDRGPRATKVYDRYEYEAEKRGALQAWADELEHTLASAPLRP